VKVLILTATMAPYRVNVFNEIGKSCDLTVCFEQQHDASREKDWFASAGHCFRSIALKGWEKPVRRLKPDIARQVFREHFDLAIAYEYATPTSMLFLLLCRLKGLPYLINCDGAFIERHTVKDLIKRFFIRGAAACLANGAHARAYFLHHGAKAERIHSHHFTSLYESDILPAVPEPAEKARLRSELGWAGYAKIVITVGRFIPSKRIDVLISAWAAMPSDWLCVIVGSGELEPEYRRQMAQLFLANIRLPGHQDSAALKRMYMASDLFVLPTESDVWGLVVNEALASGLPVVTTDKCIAGLELLAAARNGAIVPTGQPGPLAETMKALLLDEDRLREASAQALESIRDYTYESVAQSHLETMEWVATGQPRQLRV